MNDATRPAKAAARPDLIEAGQVFGRWVTLTAAPRQKDRALCRCSCGAERLVRALRLRGGLTAMCARCARAELIRRRRETRRYVRAGERYGKLAVLEDAPVGRTEVLCRCDCGTEKRIMAHNLRKKNGTKSCGCLVKGSTSTSSAVLTKHGLSKDPLYSIWRGMVKRTTDPADKRYEDYGGRGIKVHEPWLTDVVAFATWIEENLGPRPDGYSLDRVDNDGNYEPGNLRWGTRLEQTLNRRSVRKLTRQRDAALARAAPVGGAGDTGRG